MTSPANAQIIYIAVAHSLMHIACSRDSPKQHKLSLPPPTLKFLSFTLSTLRTCYSELQKYVWEMPIWWKEPAAILVAMPTDPTLVRRCSGRFSGRLQGSIYSVRAPSFLPVALRAATVIILFFLIPER